MSGMTNKYSVLMSVYENDEPSYLDSAIKSMLQQTISPSDIVIVCDGPLTSELDQCLEEWARSDDVFNIIRLTENRGLGAALQIGLPECEFEIVARMDSDDISRPDRSAKLLGAMEYGGLDLVGGSISEFMEQPGDLEAVRVPPLSQESIIEYSKQRNPFNHVSVMFKKESVLSAGGYKPFLYMEDYYLWVRMIRNGCKCANIADIVVDVRVGSGMYKRRSNRKYLQSQRSFFREMERIGYISKMDYLRTMAARTMVSVLPERTVKAIYNQRLRAKGVSASSNG